MFARRLFSVECGVLSVELIQFHLYNTTEQPNIALVWGRTYVCVRRLFSVECGVIIVMFRLTASDNEQLHYER